MNFVPPKLSGMMAFSALILLLCIPHVGHSLSMLDQNLEEVKKSAARDHNLDGKPDGDVILVRLFRTQKISGIRKDYTFMVEKYLSDSDSNLKDILKPGDLFTMANPPQNPFTSLIKNSGGDLYVMFLRRTEKGYWIPLSMKFAPVTEDSDTSGARRLFITNPWIKATAGSDRRLSQAVPDTDSRVLREPFDDFVNRLKH